MNSKRSISLVVFVTCLGGLAGFVAHAQGAPAVAEAPYREGPIWDMTLVKVQYGFQDDYLKSVTKTWKKNLDDMKKQGVVLDYKVLSTSALGEDDWNLILMVQYKNWAALDGLDAKFRVVDAKNVGDEAAVRTLMTKRLEIREIVGTKIAQELILNGPRAPSP